MFSQRMQSQAREACCPVKQQAQTDKDSGMYDSYSLSQKGSVSSSGVYSAAPTTASANTTTASSAYSSAASSSCFNSNVALNRVPFHPGPSSPYAHRSSCVIAPTSPMVSKAQASRSASLKSARSIADERGCLFDRVNGKIYEKKRLLGKGGFARVYEVVDISGPSNEVPKQTMAAKVLDKSRISRANQREKIDIEIELLSEACGHPNVVNYIDSFEDANSVCILLEMCNKKSLAQYIRSKQYLSEAEVSDILLQIVSGLEHLHGKGIVHRDLKLGNILLTDDLQVKIGDFGLATRTSLGKKRTICGTPNFIAPEVLQRQGHGPESDIWSLGCLLYTLLVGKAPFETSSLKETYRCILKNSFRIPATVSSEAADLVKRMLRPKPNARPTLSEIASHALFKKHAAYLESIRKPVLTRSVGSFSSGAPSQFSFSSIRSAKDQSLGKVSDEKVVETNSNWCSETKSSKSAKQHVKSLACRLQKKLSKVSSKKHSQARQETAKAAVQPEDQRLDRNANEIKRSDKTWVNKWVDYSNRYGFGYQLLNGKICVLFNDGKHIAINPSTKIIEYAATEFSKVICFQSDSVPPCLAKYAAVLNKFTSYMGEAASGQNCSASALDQSAEDARLLAWCRTNDYVAMYFNNGTMQVNFIADHMKVGVASIHDGDNMLFTVMDQSRKETIYNRYEFLECRDAAVTKKLRFIHAQLHDFFDLECSTHPLCALCC